MKIAGDGRRPNIRILSLGEPVLHILPNRRARAELALVEHGYRVTYGAHAFEMSSDFKRAGSASARASDLMEAFEDGDVDAVMAADAGEGSSELLEFLDPRIFIDNPKPFIGFCDNAYINVFLATRCGLASRYGYTLLYSFGEPGGPFRETWEHFEAAMSPGESFICEPFASRTNEKFDFLDPENESRIRSRNVAGGLDWIRHGTALGRLVGGEISLLPDMVRNVGMNLAGGILFWDVSYHGLPVEALFEDLCEIDAVRDIEAMLVGAHPDLPLQAWSDCVRSLVEKYLPNTNYPVIVNTCISHLSPCWLVPFSEECRLDKNGSLVFRWDRG